MDFRKYFNSHHVYLHPYKVVQMVKNLLQYRRHRFISWIRKISWRRAGPPIPVFLPGEPHGQRSLVGYSPWGCRVRHDWAAKHIFFFFLCLVAQVLDSINPEGIIHRNNLHSHTYMLHIGVLKFSLRFSTCFYLINRCKVFDLCSTLCCWLLLFRC